MVTKYITRGIKIKRKILWIQVLQQELNRKEEKSKQNTYLLKALANSRKIRLEQERYEKSSKIWNKLQIDKEKSVRRMKQVISHRITAMKILGIAYPKHWILLVVSKYLDENLMQIDLLVLSNWIYLWLSIICFA